MNLVHKFIKVNERLTWWDIIWKYTIRDTFLGLLAMVPASFGVGGRWLLLRFYMKKVGKGFTVRSFVNLKYPENLVVRFRHGVRLVGCGGRSRSR